jgi:hypothetical protein
MSVDPRPVGDCHFCGEPFSMVLVGIYRDEVWAARHDGPGVYDHVPKTSEDVWTAEAYRP